LSGFGLLLQGLPTESYENLRIQWKVPETYAFHFSKADASDSSPAAISSESSIWPSFSFFSASAMLPFAALTMLSLWCVRASVLCRYTAVGGRVESVVRVDWYVFMSSGRGSG